MDYKTLSEMLYKVVKHPSQWNLQDIKRAGKMQKILQREIEKELSLVSSVAVNDGVIKSDETPVTTSQEHVSFMQRIFTEHDATFDASIINQAPGKDTIEKNNVDVTAPVTVGCRFFVTIICSSIIKKPPYQIFRGDDIIEKDFMTDQVTKTNSVIYAVIDATVSDITTTLNEYFTEACIISTVMHNSDWVPQQYKTVWHNKTKLK